MAFFKNSKGQAALEYMIVISFAFLLAAPLLIRAQDSTQNLKTSTRLAVAKNSLNTIEDAARIANSQGPPAQITFSIQVPSKVLDSTVKGNQISIRLRAYGGATDLFNIIEFNVSGEIPTSKGRFKMRAKAEVNYVNITQAS